MTGYEKSPDYGGPDPGWKGIVIFVLVLILIGYAIWVSIR